MDLTQRRIREFQCANQCGMIVQTVNRTQKYCKHCAPLVKKRNEKAYKQRQKTNKDSQLNYEACNGY